MTGRERQARYRRRGGETLKAKHTAYMREWRKKQKRLAAAA
jgi:hypothetical protein